MTPSITLAQLKKLDPCSDQLVEVQKLIKFGRRKITAKQAVAAGVSLDDLIWICSAVALNDADVERRLRLWMADCAARVLHIFEKDHPDDLRVRNAIIVARQFARGKIDAAAWNAAGAAAWDAAWDAAGAAAWDAAGAAAWNAAGAAAWAAAWDAAWDAAGAAAGDAAGDAERNWQLTRLVEWMSDPEPVDLELPPIRKS